MEATLTFIKLTNYQEGVSAKGAWKKQEAVFETRGEYPKKVAVSGFNAMADSLAMCKPQQAYDLKLEIESREWNGRWYTEGKCFGLRQHDLVKPEQAAPAPNPLPLDEQLKDDPKDDLPF